MRWRLSLSHEVAGSITSSEFEGLTSAVIGLTRHPLFHTLVKEFKTPFRAYGSNGVQDGRRDWLKNIESTYGPDTVIYVTVEYAPDDYTFQTLYEGEVGIQTFIEGLEMDHYLEFTPVQTGMWRNFISRYDVPVNIQSAVSLDGNAVTVYAPETLTMTSQVIRYSGSYLEYWSYYVYAALDPSNYNVIQFDWSTFVQDDINKGFVLTQIQEYANELEALQGISGNFQAIADGDYRIRLKIVSAELNFNFSLGEDRFQASPDSDIYISKIGSATKTLVSTNTVVTNGDNSYLVSEVDCTVSLLEGDQIGIYIYVGNVMTIFGINQIKWKTRVDLKTTVPIVLSGEQTIDGVATSSSDVLVANQTLANENGIYVTGAGAWVRRSDSNTGVLITYAGVKVISGTINGGTLWKQEKEITDIITGLQLWSEIPKYGLIDNAEEYAFTTYGVVYDGPTVENYLEITAETVFRETENPAILQHDVAASICDRTTESGKFYAPVIGSPYTQSRTYSDSGSWWNNVLLKGVHIRGYTISEKLFTISMKEWWEGHDPMFNSSLGYETIAGEERIVLRTKAEAYDSSSMSVLLSGVQRIKRKYGPDYFNGVKTGFSKGKTEDISGIDDPQTQTRASIFKNIGRVFTNLTNWIAQGLTIEQARRTTKIKSADYKFDDDTFIVEVTRTGINEYSPRLDEDYTSVTNLLNEDTRYNKHHTPVRFTLRWLNYLSGGLQKYLGTVWRFTGGEGNYDMTSTMVDGSAPDDFDGNVLAENADIPVTNDYLWIPQVFEIEHYLTFAEFKTIDDNRNLAIGVSQTDADHAEFFIDDIQFEIMSGQVKIIGKFKNEFDIITTPPGGQIFQGGRYFDSTFDYTFE